MQADLHIVQLARRVEGRRRRLMEVLKKHDAEFFANVFDLHTRTGQTKVGLVLLKLARRDGASDWRRDRAQGLA